MKTQNNSTTQPETMAPANAPALIDADGHLTMAGITSQIVAELAQLARDKTNKTNRDNKTANTFADSHAAFEALLDSAIANDLKPITDLYHTLLTHYVDKDKKEQVKALDLLKKRTVRYCAKQETADVLRVKTTGGAIVVSWQPQDKRKVMTDDLKKAAGAFCKEATEENGQELRGKITDVMIFDAEAKEQDMSDEARQRVNKLEEKQIRIEQENAALLAELAELKATKVA